MGKIEILKNSIENLDEFSLLSENEERETNGGLCFFWTRVIIPPGGVGICSSKCAFA
jgi:hypothetical protein